MSAQANRSIWVKHARLLHVLKSAHPLSALQARGLGNFSNIHCVQNVIAPTLAFWKFPGWELLHQLVLG